MIETVLNPSERLVGMGMRCSLICLRADCAIERCAARDALHTTLAARALPIVLQRDFLVWSLALVAHPIEVLPITAATFGRDERLAIALVAACQHDRCPALTACACALLGERKLGSGNAGRVISATVTLARALQSLDEHLPQPPHGDPSAHEAPRTSLH